MIRLLSLLLLLFPLIAHAETYSIATGSPSGIYYPLGGGLAKLWSDHDPAINMKAEVTNGSVANLIQVARGESEVGISQGDAFADAVAGKGKFPEPLPLVALTALYPNLVHLLVPADSDIQSIHDLKGKRVSIGAPGSGNMVTSLKVLKALGMSTDDFTPYYLSYTETSTALADGVIDAGFIVGGIGVAAVVELALTSPIRLVPFSDADMVTIQQAQPAYRPFEVPVDTYRGIDTPVQTVSLWNLLVVHRDLPEAVADSMVRLAYEHQKSLQNVAAPIRYMSIEATRRAAWEHLHPAAKRYFEGVQP